MTKEARTLQSIKKKVQEKGTKLKSPKSNKISENEKKNYVSKHKETCTSFNEKEE